MRGRWSLGERTESKAAVSSHSRCLYEEEQNNPSETEQTLDRSSTTEESLHPLTLDTYLKSLLSQTPRLGSERFSFKEIITVIQTESDEKAITHPNLLVYQLSGHFHLLRRSTDGEDPDVGVGVWRRISLQLHMSAGLLVDVLYGLST